MAEQPPLEGYAPLAMLAPEEHLMWAAHQDVTVMHCLRAGMTPDLLICHLVCDKAMFLHRMAEMDRLRCPPMCQWRTLWCADCWSWSSEYRMWWPA